MKGAGVDLTQLLAMLHTVEQDYSDVVCGDMSFGEWACFWQLPEQELDVGLTDNTIVMAWACPDSLDGTPVVNVGQLDGETGELLWEWELSLRPVRDVLEPIGHREPCFKWELEVLEEREGFVSSVGEALEDLVENKHKPPVILL